MENVQISSTLQSAKKLVESLTISSYATHENQLYINIAPDSLNEAIKILFENKLNFLSAITGLDRPAPSEGQSEAAVDESAIEVLYHICNGADVLTLRVKIPYSNPVVPTICNLIPSASMYERELMEMFGVEVKDTPISDRLLLPDEWPENLPPLRKSFTGLNETDKE